MQRATLALLLAVAFCATAAHAQQRVFATDGCIEAMPGQVTDLSATAKSDTEIVIAWNAPSGDVCVDTYEYQVYEKGQPEPRTVAPRQGSYSVTVSGLKPNTEYMVRVAAVNSLKGKGSWAASTAKTDRRCPWREPGSIGNVYANQANNQVLYLSWLPPTAGGCANEYKIVGEDQSGNRVLNMLSTSPDARAVNLRPNVQYTFRITPKNKRGDGPTKRVTYRMQQKGRPGNGPVASGSISAGH